MAGDRDYLENIGSRLIDTVPIGHIAIEQQELPRDSVDELRKACPYLGKDSEEKHYCVLSLRTIFKCELEEFIENNNLPRNYQIKKDKFILFCTTDDYHLCPIYKKSFDNEEQRKELINVSVRLKEELKKLNRKRKDKFRDSKERIKHILDSIELRL